MSQHPLYRELGHTATARQAAYRALFRARLGDDFLNGLRQRADRPSRGATKAR